jgi:cytochrome c-type biogenesis protein CcmE
MQQALVYFVTPSEVQERERGPSRRQLRVGGMVAAGSLKKNLKTLSYRFQLTDGKASIPVSFQGIPPDLFSEGKGAVVEGKLGPDGVLYATTIMAKHAEEYSPPPDGHPSATKSFLPAKEELGT